MTTPTPTRRRAHPGQRADTLHGVGEEQGPLVRQPAPAARLARILHHSATVRHLICLRLVDPSHAASNTARIPSTPVYRTNAAPPERTEIRFQRSGIRDQTSVLGYL